MGILHRSNHHLVSKQPQSSDTPRICQIDTIVIIFNTSTLHIHTSLPLIPYNHYTHHTTNSYPLPPAITEPLLAPHPAAQHTRTTPSIHPAALLRNPPSLVPLARRATVPSSTASIRADSRPRRLWRRGRSGSWGRSRTRARSRGLSRTRSRRRLCDDSRRHRRHARRSLFARHNDGAHRRRRRGLGRWGRSRRRRAAAIAKERVASRTAVVSCSTAVPRLGAALALGRANACVSRGAAACSIRGGDEVAWCSDGGGAGDS
jgi:hypothetical protein